LDVLLELTEGDLEKFGSPLGPRKKLHKAVAGLLAEAAAGCGEAVPSPRSAPRETSGEHLIGDIKRRTDVVGILPHDATIVRLMGALLLEQNEEWAVGRRYRSLESLASFRHSYQLRLHAVAARLPRRTIRGPAPDRSPVTCAFASG
jgi:Transposase, Mutator family